MSMVFENEDKEVYVVLSNNDYVKVMTFDKKKVLLIRNEDGKFIIQESEYEKNEKKDN